MRTTRERIADRLRRDPATPSALAREFDTARSAVTDHVQHVARSLSDAEEELLVRPPECGNCGFDGFDDRLTVPSRCPECRAEDVAEPAFVIE